MNKELLDLELADYFGREAEHKAYNQRNELKEHMISNFNRKQFLKDCGVSG